MLLPKERWKFDLIPELDIADVPNFFEWEVECRDNCGQAIVQPKLVWLVQFARNYAQVPFHVTSWNRCDDHNLLVGGVKGSSHLTGWAIDIAMSSNYETNYTILDALMFAKFPIIKIRRDHFHVDLNPEKRWWILLP